tara:strand:- start:2595 stop:3773 length:1179 start_codon:yes stop_codon:yes gene_type:complete
MKIKKYPLALNTWDNKEISKIKLLLSKGQLTMGKYVKKYENIFAKKNKNKYAIMTNSGSSSNLLMFSALFYTKQNNFKLKQGDEIIVPSVSWSTSYTPIYQLNLKMKFVDIDLDTLNYDLKELKKKVTRKTRAILCVNVLGNSNNYSEIKKIIKNKNIFLIEDSCESMGSQFEKSKVGNFGIMSSFSSYFSHHISTIEGGVITTDNKELYHILLSLRAHGWTRDLPNKNLVIYKSKNKIKEMYNFVLPGYNLRPTEINGVAGIEQLKKFNYFLKKRRENGTLFVNLFKNHKIIKIQKEIGRSSWFAFSMIIKNNSLKNLKKLIKILDKLKVEYRPIISGNFADKYVSKKYFKTNNKNLKNAKYLDKFGIMIGNNPVDMKYILNKLSEELSVL